MKKKILKSLLLALTISSCVGTTLLADTSTVNCDCGYSIQDHKEHFSNIHPLARYQKCICGEKIITSKVYTGSWLYTGNSKECTHLVNGHDYELVQTIRYKSECTSCSYFTEFDKKLYKWECRGF